LWPVALHRGRGSQYHGRSRSLDPLLAMLAPGVRVGTILVKSGFKSSEYLDGGDQQRHVRTFHNEMLGQRFGEVAVAKPLRNEAFVPKQQPKIVPLRPNHTAHALAARPGLTN
ncbi:MAG TPA: hypothetical protein VN648_11720, partial [Candidatus Methylomirabilis sp.]|nr:hypothetical protein [Candidatus Methylomirabilis sp.]